jgi:hypothetical protein
MSRFSLAIEERKNVADVVVENLLLLHALARELES